MQHVNQASKFKLLSTSFLAFLIMLLSSSCSKNSDVLPGANNMEVKALNQSSSSKMNNSLVAVPFEETFFVPCANGGAGENVTLTGTTNFVYQMTWTDHGFKLVYHANSRGITGVGLTSGETFVGSEGTQGSVVGSWVNNQWIGNTIERMRIIGRNTTYIVKNKYQLIVTPDGKVTVNSMEKTIDCDVK
ncbi:MAG TPA: hypothetical protein VFN95_19000 [Flavitalea sp.]|nr:hypothetical protein [Flavitalea sp.]